MTNTHIDILLIEDNPADADYLKELLADIQTPAFTIVQAERLADGLKKLKERNFSIVLLDLALPDSQGLDTVLAVRQLAPRVPIIVLTGLSDEQIGLQALQMDAQDYLIKGQFKTDLLVRSIQYAIERKKILTTLQESEELYRTTYEYAPVGIELLDFTGSYLRGNGWLSRLLGYTETELKQLDFMRITHPDDLKTEQPLLEELLANRIPLYKIRKRYLHKDGHTIWVRVTSSLVKVSAPYRISIIEDITRYKQAEDALRENEARLRFVTEHSPDNIFIQDHELFYIWVARPDQPFAREDYLGKTDFELFSSGEASLLTQLKKQVIQDGQALTTEVPLTMKNKVSIFKITIEPWRDLAGNIMGIAGYAHDITARKQEEESMRRWAEIFKNTRIGVGVSSPDGKHLELINPAFAEMHGYTIAELTHALISEVFAPENQQDLITTIKKVQEKGYHVQETVHIRKDGSRFPVLITISGVKDETGRVLYRIANVQDITEQKKAEATIQFRTYHDLLTGLPNRAQFMLKLDLELAQANRNNNKLAVLHIDLDRFRTINESLGHAMGDKIILAVTERLRSFIRKNDIFARISGDEFIILFTEMKRVEEAARLAQKITESMQKPLKLKIHEFYITVSIGISIYPDDGEKAEILLQNADIAVSQVKQHGRNNYQFFNPALNIRTVERLLLENDLRNAIERGELELYYQPQVSIKNGTLIAWEALIRWRHPAMGLLAPSRFIPIAEEIGVISMIDEWVLRTACAQNKAWQEAGWRLICITVNLSTQQFQQPTLVTMTQNILRETKLAPEYLDIEITESTAMQDIDVAVPNLKKLHGLGVELSIDDFGTGYSSLSYLKRFPVHKLKIDQSFIRGIPGDPDSQAIVKAVIAMGHNLQLRVIAEGVETEEQLAFLRESGCDEIQGYLVSEPVPARQAEKIMASR